VLRAVSLTAQLCSCSPQCCHMALCPWWCALLLISSSLIIVDHNKYCGDTVAWHDAAALFYKGGASQATCEWFSSALKLSQVLGTEHAAHWVNTHPLRLRRRTYAVGWQRLKLPSSHPTESCKFVGPSSPEIIGGVHCWPTWPTGGPLVQQKLAA
jgi:hypothetical protein